MKRWRVEEPKPTKFFYSYITLYHVTLDKRIVNWVKKNLGKEFSSTRKKMFGTNTIDFELVNIDDTKVSIRFLGSNYNALPLKLWMFERTLKHLSNNYGSFVPIGARIRPPYIPNSVEEAIWKKPLPEDISTYKVAPHICDVLEIAGIVEFGFAHKDNSKRKLQGVKLQTTCT